MGDTGHVVPTARTSLRLVSMQDVGYLHRLWTDPAVRRFFWDDEVITRGRAEAAVREAVEVFGRHGLGLWISERREGGGSPIGFCGLRHLDGGPEVEILYGIQPPEWGRGFATEIAQAVLRYGFETAGLARVWGVADRENVASRRVLEKVGMTFEGLVVIDGREEARYAIRAEDLRSAPSAAQG
ncbi:MAG: Acetyltransferase, GNAT family [uncultured Rubrobacteraceae bacterium]|uniref:Acetyltransferase, GNAT family n=1 Tax=uncultured Rubrobacteraceae bacterium TaxID=349277 RepID=A0A6J4TCM2_9ACTN|nr:MAG: Acetyltransferase, GNAT family [uncultured Rubrobacteraceae bacterium]